ncbi:hypothetical protein [Marivita sp. XM-24bin2]|uniref:hypothetical protein n=1 Tax=unclassified Marivita TaxID=2632480 RepID=UPI000D7AA5A1|nr:hypothetical protein [Marivita sp. XM-24bin2]MCR9108712.1 hypothetical protein [Paracoccaceae bacterium]PWL34184.1 MAG: hypothetical protein DCO97_15865 [Marivita sp. XM-24bin2]
MFDTGDVIVSTKWPGHVVLIYDSKHAVHGKGVKTAASSATDITTSKGVTRHGGFLLEEIKQEISPGRYAYLTDGQPFRFPWHKYREAEVEFYKDEIKRNADIIRKTASYGFYRAGRLMVGDSKFGSGAAKRLLKYKSRVRGTSLDDISKAVGTITCSEAVILTMQLTFQPGTPGFIQLDGAHTMPNTLAAWLKAHWK